MNYLPKDYMFLTNINLMKSRPALIFMQIAYILVVLFMVGLIFIFDFPVILFVSVPIFILLSIVACILYIVLHELTHGLFIYILSGSKPVYKIKLPYASTGTDAYLKKSHYIIIALAPVIFLGILLIVLLALLPQSAFLLLYIVLIFNFAGAVGDAYIVYKMSRLPTQILIQDSGVSMNIYFKKPS